MKDRGVASKIRQLVDEGQPWLGAFMTRQDDYDLDHLTSIDDVHRVGVFAQIIRVNDPSTAATGSLDSSGGDGEDSGEFMATILPHRRLRLTEISNEKVSIKDDSASSSSASIEGVLTYAQVENLQDEPCMRKNPVVKALTSEILSVMKDLLRHNPGIKDQITSFSYASGISLVDDPSMLADFVASIVPYGDSAEYQAILESLVIEERLQKALVLLKKELANSKLQNQINKDVEEKMAKARKEYFLLEHMKGIQKELGLESDGRDRLVEGFKTKAAQLAMPTTVKKVFDEELMKFQTLEPAAMEFNVTRNYLEWLTSVPWGKHTLDNFDLKRAKDVLDAEHYGMKDVKERILEFIAVGKLNKSIQGKILCLNGPPGVGKTSIGKSIAKALGRDFYRFSVGGLGDVSEIKGHRRTYVGAMPGKIVQALKKVNSENPMILIDEIDKVGRNTYRGDPSSALLEVLDPEQNSTFTDHFMDVPIDLSKVLFMCTSNVLDTIPGPLLDRMEVIELSGYITDEKLAIADKYLCPASMESIGLTKDKVELTHDALHTLINYYCRESGVRNLKKHVDKIYRKSALKLLRENADKIVIDSHNLKDFVGNPIFTDEKISDNPAGVVMGLAWTGMGGTSLFIESIADNLKQSAGSIVQTGQLGDVMKESISIAYTYAKTFVNKKYPDNTFFDKAAIHLHVPEGATPKDGPSAGITMCTSLISLALGQSVPKIAMTGELTLTGHVLKIGGVKEKLLAAKRSGVKTVLFPADNEVDYDELDDQVKSGIEVKFVKTFSDVFNLIFAK